MAEFSDRDGAKALLESTLEELSAVQREQLIDACIDQFREPKYPSLPPGIAAPLVIPRMHWVIRPEDLAAVQTFADALRTQASTAPFTSVKGVTLTDVLPAAFLLYKRLHKLGITLTIDQCQALVALQRAGSPATSSELTKHTALTVQELEQTLRSLTELRCSDGSALDVSCDAEGRWSARQ